MDVDAELARVGEELADAVIACLPAWSERVVTERLLAQGGSADPALVEAATTAGREAAAALGPELRTLLTADVDRQAVNPLAIVRRAVAWPTEVLRAADVGPVRRDEYDQRHFPDDVYGLTPRGFGDVDPALTETGLLWGALKARAHLARHGR